MDIEAQAQELYAKHNKLKDDMSDCKLYQQKKSSELELQIKENATQIGLTKTMIHDVGKSVKDTSDKVGQVVQSIKPVIDKFNDNNNSIRLREKIFVGVAIVVIGSLFLWIGTMMLTGFAEKLLEQISKVK